MPRRAGASRRAPLGLGLACAAMSLSLVACTHGHSDGGGGPAPSGKSATPTGVSTRPRVRDEATGTAGTGRSVLAVPQLGGGDTVVGRRAPGGGSASIEFGEGRKGDALVVAVACEGRGRVRVAVRSIGTSFPLECRAGRVSSVLNEMALTGADQGGTVSVEASSAVRWSLTVGRSRSAPTPEVAIGTDGGGE
ncbi:hypothetical protein [Streptomyces gibsoniae]|uniref:Lipoprotein n=1 Tax=Streptomyces gibsoniae TaxID=3075529 RepID=A0ABU2TNF5_9ACTN|nr:hypothetical protein [Streptomyces sp. DSM 41699]MDT0462463.1 hypothetical protein [Streptomyces sp. DSM 41699]